MEEVPGYAGMGPRALGGVRAAPFRGGSRASSCAAKFVVGIGNAYADEILGGAAASLPQRTQLTADVDLAAPCDRATLIDATDKITGSKWASRSTGRAAHLPQRTPRNRRAVPTLRRPISLVSANQRITNFAAPASRAVSSRDVALTRPPFARVGFERRHLGGREGALKSGGHS